MWVHLKIEYHIELPARFKRMQKICSWKIGSFEYRNGFWLAKNYVIRYLYGRSCRENTVFFLLGVVVFIQMLCM